MSTESDHGNHAANVRALIGQHAPWILQLARAWKEKRPSDKTFLKSLHNTHTLLGREIINSTHELASDLPFYFLRQPTTTEEVHTFHMFIPKVGFVNLEFDQLDVKQKTDEKKLRDALSNPYTNEHSFQFFSLFNSTGKFIQAQSPDDFFNSFKQHVEQSFGGQDKSITQKDKDRIIDDMHTMMKNMKYPVFEDIKQEIYRPRIDHARSYLY